MILPVRLWNAVASRSASAEQEDSASSAAALPREADFGPLFRLAIVAQSIVRSLFGQGGLWAGPARGEGSVGRPVGAIGAGVCDFVVGSRSRPITTG